MFQKGYTPWNKGKSPSPEHRAKISRALTGRIPKNILLLRTPEVRRKAALGTSRGRMGMKFSKEHIENLRKARLGKKHSKEWVAKHIARLKIRWSNPEYRKKISDAQKKIGNMPPHPKREKHHWWRGGITDKNAVVRSSKKYRDFRVSIMQRDNYACVMCKKRGGILNVDHIKPFAFFEELRFEISNARTLCLDCHKNTDTYLSKAYNHRKNVGVL